VLALLLVGCGGTKTASPPATSAGTGSSSGAALAPSSPTTGMKTVKVSALPPEAVRTLELIAAGGPYPYSKDGVTFQNREGLLPKKPSGFYHEFTVETPGSSDRGARRIISGDDGSRFYTSDHYGSFREVIEG
jgi:ribonuclease T1